MKDMSSRPGLATSLLCGLGQITEPLWTFIYSALNAHVGNTRFYEPFQL